MFLIILELKRSTPLGLVYRLLHGVGNLVGIHYHLAIEISGRTTHCLRKRTMTTQETFLIGVENSDKRHFGKVEALSQQIDADEDIIFAGAQTVENFYTVESIDIAVYICCLYLEFEEIFVEFFGHTLRQRSHKSTFVALYAKLNLFEEIVDLVH